MHRVVHGAVSPLRVVMALAIAGLGVAFALAAAPSARAAGPALFANGLHIASGAIEDPAGRMWVTDHNSGFCRLTNPASGPATIDHPQTPGDPSTRTCLGGLLPHAGPGPDAAMAPVFIDPSPSSPGSGDEFALIPDVAAPSADVVRADWNARTHKFEFRDVITMDADPLESERPRPAALSLAADGSVYAVFQRSGSVQRIVNPEAAKPTVQLVARTSDGLGAGAVAAVHGEFGPFSPAKIIIAEATGLTETVGTPTDPAAPRSARDSFYDVPAGPAGPSLIGALAYEVTSEFPGTGVLFAGTGNAEVLERPGPDKVYRWDSAPRAAAPGTLHADGFSSISGLGLRPQGGADTLYVLDDTTIVTAGEPLGTGTMYEIVPTWARIYDGPEGATNQVRPVFTFDGDPALECKLAGPGHAGAYKACTSPLNVAPAPTPDQQPQDAPPLEAGSYTFSVRPVTQSNDAPAQTRSFIVDTTAKAGKPTIMSPTEGKYTPARPYFQFAPPAGLPEGGYVCQIVAEGATPAGYVPCAEGRPVQPLTPGTHTMTIKAVDGAGNEGLDASDPVTFHVGSPAADADNEAVGTALTAPDSWTDYAGGLHIATGALEAPDGSVWVTDHNAGFCRISKPSISGPAKIEHPELPGAPAADPRTCLGGLLPEARAGADAAGQPVLVDPTPGKRGSGDEVVLVVDGATKSGSLWRAQWNASTGRFDPLDEFVGPLDAKDRGPRPTAAALGADPDGNGPQQPDLFYITKKEDWVVRVQNPATDPVASIVGATANGRGAEALAVGTTAALAQDGSPILNTAGKPVLKPVLYIGEPLGITRLIDPQGPVAGRMPQAQPLSIDGAPLASTLAYDKARHFLYAGTANAAGEAAVVPPIPATPGSDRVMRFHVGGTDKATPDTPQIVGAPFGKFSMVGGLGVRHDGRLLVADDVALTMASEPLGTGRLFQVGAPAARISAGPSDAGEPALDPTWTSSPNPEFKLEGDGPMECALREKADGPETALNWTACTPADPNVPLTVTAASLSSAPLVSGKSYRLTVRSTKGYTAPADPNEPKDIDDATKYVPHTVEFTFDNGTPGTPVLSVDKTDELSNASPMFGFTPAGEEASGLEWRCDLNGAGFKPCNPGRTYPLTENGTSQLIDQKDGDNKLLVKAVDRAGNASAPAELLWKAETTIPVVNIASTPAGTAEFVRTRGVTPVTFTTAVVDGGPGGAPSINCRLNGEAWRNGCADITPEYANLPSGTHVFKAHAIDHYGNHSVTASRKVVVDTQGPAVRFDTSVTLGVTGPNPTITFGADPETVGEGESGQTFECTLVRPDGSETPVVPCAAPSVSLGHLALQSGEHTLRVIGTDDLNNVGSAATFTWTVDASGPVVTFAAGDPADGVELLNRPTFTFTANEDAAFQCAYLLGDTIVQDFRLCRSPERSGGLPPSNEVYTFVLVARDRFGNVGQYRRSFRIVDALNTPAPVAAAPSQVSVVVPPLSTPTPSGQGQGQGRSQGPGQGQGQRRGGAVPDIGVPITLAAPALQAQGLPVTVRAAAGTNVVQVQVFAVTGGATVRAAAAKKQTRRLVATFWQMTPKAKTYRLRIKDRKVRNLRPGRYVVSVRGGATKKTLGEAATKTFVVKR
ncbi:MAG: hypothetical protein QOH46_3568 [Solirubrobacteraceae bacterium]|nr:hypothetical protein [Solirubrobacteraceae bacterium]